MLPPFVWVPPKAKLTAPVPLLAITEFTVTLLMLLVVLFA